MAASYRRLSLPILKLIAGTPELSLSQDDIDALVEAFDATLVVLKIDRGTPKAEWVAGHVIAVAKLGERNPTEITQLVVANVQAKRPKRD